MYIFQILPVTTVVTVVCILMVVFIVLSVRNLTVVTTLKGVRKVHIVKCKCVGKEMMLQRCNDACLNCMHSGICCQSVDEEWTGLKW
jgi:hypothetical protein